MLRIRPFSALRPRPELAQQVASVPYDVVDGRQARALVEAEPMSFLRVVRSEVDLPEGTDPYSAAVYEAARRRLDALREAGTLLREPSPSIYLYRQRMALGDRILSQVGVVACCQVDDYLSGRIKKHELTRKAKEDDRTRHVLATGANTGPVFLLHHDDVELQQRVEIDTQAAPLYDFEATDGVTHTIWRVADPAAYVHAFARHDVAYVADGHHRSASAARAGQERARANPKHRGDEEYNWFLAVLFPASSLTVLPYHRVVQDLAARSADDLLDALRGLGRIEPTEHPEPSCPGSFGMYLAGRWYRVTFDEASIDRDDPVASLDCALLGERVLGPLLGIEDVRTDPRIDFVGGIHGPAELERRVDEGQAAVAFAMHPTGVRELMAVADAGRIMPPKSTWFEPKLRSGLLVHTLD